MDIRPIFGSLCTRGTDLFHPKKLFSVCRFTEPNRKLAEHNLDEKEKGRRTSPDEEQLASNMEMPVIGQTKTNRSRSEPQQDGQLETEANSRSENE